MSTVMPWPCRRGSSAAYRASLPPVLKGSRASVTTASTGSADTARTPRRLPLGGLAVEHPEVQRGLPLVRALEHDRDQVALGAVGNREADLRRAGLLALQGERAVGNGPGCGLGTGGHRPRVGLVRRPLVRGDERERRLPV